MALHRGACPYLLLDAGFVGPYRRRWVGANRVGEREPVTYTAFFTSRCTARSWRIHAAASR
jgi:hypothetical protein